MPGGSYDVSRNPKFLRGQQKDEREIIDISQLISVVRMLLGVSS